jgi:hypothetical protein
MASKKRAKPATVPTEVKAKRMRKKAFDAASVRPDHLAKAAGPPPTEE